MSPIASLTLRSLRNAVLSTGGHASRDTLWALLNMRSELRHEHGRAGQLALAQPIERLVGGGKWHRHHRGLHASHWRECQELARILAREIGDRAHHALLPEEF